MLIAVGTSMVFADEEADEAAEDGPGRVWSALALGIGVSLDELAIGFTIGVV